MTEKYAVYVRRSTAEQDDEHQLSNISDWLDRRGLEIGDVDVLKEQGSGASADRKKFRILMDRIEDGDYTDVVVVEISRIARKGLLAQEFFELCDDQDVTIHVTNGSVRKVEPNGQGRMVAGIIAEVAAEERRNLIRRTKSGVKQAQKQGKWTGSPPAGFRVDGGYLRPIVDPVDGEVSYMELQEALERVQNGESQRAVAKDLPLSRQGLSKIWNDEDRRTWYLDAESDDEKVQAALDSISG